MIWVMFRNKSKIYFFFFSIQDINSNCYTFFNFFPIIFFWKCILFQFYLSMKGLIFAILLQIFPVSSWFWHKCYSILKAFLIFFIEETYCSFFVFLSNDENLYMIHHDSDLFHDIYKIFKDSKLSSIVLPAYHFLNALHAIYYYLWNR